MARVPRKTTMSPEHKKRTIAFFSFVTSALHIYLVFSEGKTFIVDILFMSAEFHAFACVPPFSSLILLFVFFIVASIYFPGIVFL